MFKESDFKSKKAYQNYLASMKELVVEKDGWFIADRIKPNDSREVLVFVNENSQDRLVIANYYQSPCYFRASHIDGDILENVKYWRELPPIPNE